MATDNNPVTDETVVLKLKNRRPITYTRSKTTSKNTKNFTILGRNDKVDTVYYLRGVKSEATKYIPTGKIQVSFGKETNVSYKTFAAENNLEFIREINQLYHTAIFKMAESEDAIALSNELNQLREVRYAKPDWIVPRRPR